MDSLFGVENCQENLCSGQYGIEAVINYLKAARQHTSWNEDELLILKLERIHKCFEEYPQKLYEILALDGKKRYSRKLYEF
ncbi:hypothetical protein PSTG_04260 [Puccinia striiformis f. sp. tritici PST-78]|uniref:Uncharacterized protein n=1 Tax=Puccinia striiformis f. sp. tritici PST-78 TaxID=1165861 RepID=A0A0L0VTQ7_9BASI|nr:hypothetical protein PSTG_04260 [Puccinia striiformis f. sp. tritici PST-78]